MKQYFVYHRIEPDFFGKSKPTWPEFGYILVAKVEAESLDSAFRDTNHIDQDWTMNPTVKTVGKHRSTSVGDVIVDPDGKVWWCKRIGWEEIKGFKDCDCDVSNADGNYNGSLDIILPENSVVTNWIGDDMLAAPEAFPSQNRGPDSLGLYGNTNRPKLSVDGLWPFNQRGETMQVVTFLRSGEVTWASKSGKTERREVVKAGQKMKLKVSDSPDCPGALVLWRKNWSIVIDPANVKIT